MQIISNIGNWVKLNVANVFTPIVGSRGDAMMVGEVFKWIFFIALILIIITLAKKVYRIIKG